MNNIPTLADVNKSDFEKSPFVILEEYDPQGLYHPSKIVWRKSVTAPTLGETMKSDKRRRVIRTIKKAQELNISIKWEESISRESFEQFRSYYVDMIQKKENGRVALEEGWYEDRIEKQKKHFALLSFYTEHTYLGGAIMEYKTQCFNISYVAYEKFPLAQLDLGLGCILIDTVIQKANEAGYTSIGYGRDTNNYGYALSLELLRYKRWYGFFPQLPLTEDQYIMQTLFLVQSVDQPLIFFTQTGQDTSSLIFSCITSDLDFAVKAYCPDSITEHQVYDTNTIVQMHREYLSQNT